MSQFSEIFFIVPQRISVHLSVLASESCFQVMRMKRTRNINEHNSPFKELVQFAEVSFQVLRKLFYLF